MGNKSIDRIKPGLLVGLSLSLTLPACLADKEKEKKNVLLIVIDDLRPALGCYGNNRLHTPNIDALANDGILFSRAYVQQAVCAASRASFLTGCRPDVTGVDYPYSKYFVEEFLPEHPTLQRFFLEHGYFSATAGKVHHGGPDDIVGKDISIPHVSIDSLKYYAKPENIIKGGKRGRCDKTLPWEIAEVADNAYKDGAMTERVVEILDSLERSEKPFYFSVGFYKPHLPFAAPKKYWDLYHRDSIPLASCPDHPDNVAGYSVPHYELHSYKGHFNKDGEPVPNDVARTLRHGYYACVSYIDAQVGKIVQELKESGQYDNTAILLIGDHGFHLGEQNNWAKHSNFEVATESPFILKAPGMKNRNLKTNALVELVDVYPTLLDLSGMPKPSYLEGISVLPLIEEPGREWKAAAFSQYPRGYLNLEGYAIRTPRYRYVEWRDMKTGEIDSRELYDHKEQDCEGANLVYKEENQELVQQLSKQLKAGWKKALPPGVKVPADNPLAPPSVSWK